MLHRCVRRSSLGLLALVTGAALLLTACSGGQEKKRPEEEMGPLDKYMMALYPHSEMTQQKLDEQHKKTEELVAKCMAKEGFEYKPNPSGGGTITTTDEGEGEQHDWSSVEFAEKYGYGIVESPFHSNINPEAIPDEVSGDSPTEQEWVDVNEDYVNSLTKKQQDAYYEALHGVPPTGENVEQEYDWKTAGCFGAAQHEIEGENSFEAASEDPEFSDMLAAIDAHTNGLYGDGMSGPSNPEVKQLEAKWASCLAESGINEYANSMAASIALTEEMNRLNGSDKPESTPKEPSKEQLEALKKKEISVAVADAKCREKLHLDDEIRKIDLAFQEKFVAEHKSELEALVAKHGANQKSS